MRHVDLDPVGAVLHLLARRLARLHRTIDDLNSLGDIDLRRIAFQGIAAGRRNAARGGDNPRSGDVALIYSHLDSDIAVTGALSLHVADGSKALLQGAPRRNRCARRAVRQRKLQQLNVVATQGRVFSLEKEVGVRLDQSRQHGGVRQVDDLCAGRDLRGSSVADGLNLVATNNNDLIVLRFVYARVNEDPGANYGDLRRCRGIRLGD